MGAAGAAEGWDSRTGCAGRAAAGAGVNTAHGASGVQWMKGETCQGWGEDRKTGTSETRDAGEKGGALTGRGGGGGGGGGGGAGKAGWEILRHGGGKGKGVRGYLLLQRRGGSVVGLLMRGGGPTLSRLVGGGSRQEGGRPLRRLKQKSRSGAREGGQPGWYRACLPLWVGGRQAGAGKQREREQARSDGRRRLCQAAGWAALAESPAALQPEELRKHVRL